MSTVTGRNQKAVFLDRDGTIIADRGYLADAGGVELLPRAGQALARLTESGFLLVLVTNQSGIGRGYFSRRAVNAQHRRLQELLKGHGARFSAIEVCPHTTEDACNCRKPQPGMLQKAARRLRIDLAQSFMIGDKVSDVQAGKAAGCSTVFIGATCGEADFTAPDLATAAQFVLGRAFHRQKLCSHEA